MGNDSTIALPRSTRPVRECPMAGVAVPVFDKLTGKPSGLAMERAACNERCALYDVANDRTCLERVLHALAGRASSI